MSRDAPTGRRRLGGRKLLAALALVLVTLWAVLLVVSVILAIAEPETSDAWPFFYTGIVLVGLALFLRWGWRRLLVEPRRARVGTDGRPTFAPEDLQEEPRGAHLGLSGESEPPQRW